MASNSGPATARWLTRERLIVAGLLAFTALVRGSVLWAMRDNLAADPDAYREIAENVLAHGVYGMGKSGQPRPTAYRPPLYPIVLSNLSAADGKHVSQLKIAVLHLILGVATVWLTYLAGRRVLASTSPQQASGGRQPPEAENSAQSPAIALASLLAALLVACDPILLNQQTLVMTETLATFLAILALWCLVRFSAHRYWWNAGLAGGAIGLAALCRPTFLPWLGLVAGAMVISDFRFQISDWRSKLPRNLANFGALAAVAAAVMAPWAIRNQQVFGKPILTTTHGGYALAVGNNEQFYKWLQTDPGELPWRSDEFDRALQFFTLMDWADSILNSSQFTDDLQKNQERRANEIAYGWARDAIQNDPGSFAVACLYRIRQLWSPLPHKLTAEESTGRMMLRYVTAAWYCAVYVLVAIGIWRLRGKLQRQPWVWGLLLCLTFTAVHTFYWSNLRMRAPLMPFVALVAAAAVVRRDAVVTTMLSKGTGYRLGVKDENGTKQNQFFTPNL